MKKSMAVFVSVLLLLLNVSLSAAAEETKPVDGVEPVKTPIPEPVPQQAEKPKAMEIVKSSFEGGIFKHNQSYIPLSPVLKQLGYQVSWNGQTQQVTAIKKNWHVVIDTNANPMKVTVNDQVMGSEINPFLKQGVTYIPAFFVTYLEAGSSVSRGDTIQITTPDQQIDVKYTIEQDPPKKTGKMVYLTFDDGPSPITPEILDILKENDVKATFFVIGQNVKAHPDILKREFDEGNAIGNHTYSHNYYTIYQNEDAFFQDLNHGEQEIEKVIGEKTDLVRLPGGSNNTVSKHAQDSNYVWIMKDIVKDLKDRGYNYFDWNAATGDGETNNYTPNWAFQNVKDEVGDGSEKEIILLAHDSATKTSTLKALPDIIQYLKDKGYTFGTLDDTVPPIDFLK